MKKLIVLSLILPLLVHAADDHEATCRAHLKDLGGAVNAYRLLHQDKPPAKLSELYLDGLIESFGDFTCPASGTSITMASEIDAQSDYALGTGDVLVREKTARHDGQALAVFPDGAIKPVEGSAPAVAALDKRGPVVATETPRLPSAATVPPTREETPAEQPDITVVEDGEFTGDFSEVLGLALAFQKDGRLVVTSVRKDGIGEQVGLQAGDQVVKINEKPAPKGAARPVTMEELAKLSNVPDGEELLLTIRRAADGEEVHLNLPTGMSFAPVEDSDQPPPVH